MERNRMKDTASHAFIADLYQKQSYAEIIEMLQHQERSVTDVNSADAAASYLAQGQQNMPGMRSLPRIQSQALSVYGSA